MKNKLYSEGQAKFKGDKYKVNKSKCYNDKTQFFDALI